ncbi:MAG: hypothetical protein KGI79_01905 [Patescibacteria group bacterium]|nr:hypothetical protein [Patescibacteria group bacterium]MDE2116606.1 hypothetical protein [Patescibacteria group bacterium]
MIHHLPAPHPVAINTDACEARLLGKDISQEEKIVCYRGEEFLQVAVAGAEHSHVRDSNGRSILIESRFIERIERCSWDTARDRVSV